MFRKVCASAHIDQQHHGGKQECCC